MPAPTSTDERTNRTSRRQSLSVALLAWAVACGGGTPPPGLDSRTPIALPPEAEQAIRAEMRTMLASLAGILAAPGADSAAVRSAARQAGTGAAADTALEHLLPEPFLQLGLATHVAFDSLATAPPAALAADSIRARLGGILGRCVACHSQYRITAR